MNEERGTYGRGILGSAGLSAGRWPAVGRPIGRPIKVKVVVVVVPTLQYSVVGCRPPAWPSPPGEQARDC